LKFIFEEKKCRRRRALIFLHRFADLPPSPATVSSRRMTKLVNRGGSGSVRGAFKVGGRGDKGGRGGGRGDRGGGKPGNTAGGGVGKKSQPERQGASSGWKDEFRDAFKWKGRSGKAVRQRTQPIHPAMKPLPKGRELTKDEITKLLHPVLQPVRAKYGGQGFARPSTFIDISSDDIGAAIKELYDERIDGFSGKSYTKLGNKQDMMEWRRLLKEKVERDGTAVVRRKKKEEADMDGEGIDKNMSEAWRGETTTPSCGNLSRKQKKKAAQMGLTQDAMFALQTSKVRIVVDEGARNNAIEAYRAQQRKLNKGQRIR